MAVTLTDHRSIYNEADATTNWTGPTSAGSTPTPVEDTQWVGANLGSAIGDMYVTPGGSVDLSDAVVYVWIFPRLTLGNTTDANGGLMLTMGDSSNLGAWKVAGADVAPFRHDNGPTFWMCLALDTTSRPASPLSRAGSAASVNFAAITRIGATANSLQAAPGMDPTWYADIIRYFLPSTNNGCAASIVGGTSGDPGTFAQIAAQDRVTTNQRGHGLVRQLAVGAFGCQGPLRFGNATGTSSSWFEDGNAVLVFESRGFRTTLYKIFITDNGTGTTTFILSDCSLIAPTGVGASFDSLTDTDVTAVTITGTRFDGFTGGIGIGGGAGQVFTGCTFSNGGAVSVTSQPVDLTGSSFLTSTVAANASALVWNVNTDPDGYLDNTIFSRGTNAHHAIEFGTTSPTTMTLRGIAFTGFSATEGGTTGDETLYIKRTTGDVTINLIGCSGNIGYRTDGANVILVLDPVTTLINIKDPDGNNEQNVRIYLQAADATGDLPFEESVTISRDVDGLATVSHTDHGMNSNEYIKLAGITGGIGNGEEDNSGAFPITVIDANSYSYTSNDTGVSSYTGTITATGATIYGLTDASGNISSSRTYGSNQPLTGYARKINDGVTPPFYKTIEIVDTVNSSVGLTINRRLVLDQ